jgi:hypothetical protein
MNAPAVQVIEALGGTAAVARIFKIAMPSVTAWKEVGIPPARMMFLRLAHKKALARIDLQAATAQKPRSLGRTHGTQELALPSTSTKEVE